MSIHADSRFNVIPNLVALRMPLYFVLSGIFFKTYEGKIFYIKKINNILVPMIFWLLISELIFTIANGASDSFYLFQIIDNPIAHHHIDSNAPLWFLMCLFFINILFFCIHKISKNIIFMSFLVIISGMTGYMLYKHEVVLPFWIDSVFSSLPFFFMGYLIKGILDYPINKFKLVILGLSCIIISYFIVIIAKGPYISWSVNMFFGNPIFAYLNSASFVLGVLMLCRVIEWLPIISYIGRYSIIALCIHHPIFYYVNMLESHILGHEIHFILNFILLVSIVWLCIPLIKKILPYFSAQKPLFKITTKEKKVLIYND